ncbi:MAG: aminotransferase class V-fold PLP-dependent enzyme [Pedosphaera sp.]|nr:aminotransferase class V-fold PLP-dependent enzyme [Pedosphaera sp.]
MLTPQNRLRDFPALAHMAYLNTAAESIPPLCTHEAIAQYVRDKNAGMRGRVAHYAAVERCRDISARLLGLAPEEVSFCSCSSEAYNLLASALQLQSHDEVIITDLDFPAGATVWLNTPTPPLTRLWRAQQGALRTADLLPLLNERTRLVQVSLVSFLNGHRLDWTPFIRAVREVAPRALVSVDITQALGRVVVDCAGADCLISSTHKWTLGIHGGCVVGIPKHRAQALTTRAGGWYHLENAFAPDRFERAVGKLGAASYSVGMPNFVALYALNASLRYLADIGVANIAAHADPLVLRLEAGLRALGLQPMVAQDPQQCSGILALQMDRSAEVHAALEAAEVHVMHNAGRLRMAVHGYNTAEDVARCLEIFGKFAK